MSMESGGKTESIDTIDMETKVKSATKAGKMLTITPPRGGDSDWNGNG